MRKQGGRSAMPLDVKTAVADAFQELLARKDVDKITVKDLVEACGISRQTFYYHFRDIVDVMEWKARREMERPPAGAPEGRLPTGGHGPVRGLRGGRPARGAAACWPPSGGRPLSASCWSLSAPIWRRAPGSGAWSRRWIRRTGRSPWISTPAAWRACCWRAAAGGSRTGSSWPDQALPAAGRRDVPPDRTLTDRPPCQDFLTRGLFCQDTAAPLTVEKAAGPVYNRGIARGPGGPERSAEWNCGMASLP